MSDEKPQFSKLDYLRDLRGAKMNPSAYRVLVTVLTYARKDGDKAYPSVATLMDDCALSESTVKRALKYLYSAGWLRQEKRGRRGSDGVGWASEYSLTRPSTGSDYQSDSVSDGVPQEDLHESQQVTGECQQVTDDRSTGHQCTVNRSSTTGQQVTSEPPIGPVFGPVVGPLLGAGKGGVGENPFTEVPTFSAAGGTGEDGRAEALPPQKHTIRADDITAELLGNHFPQECLDNVLSKWADVDPQRSHPPILYRLAFDEIQTQPQLALNFGWLKDEYAFHQ
jgi:hypothetical protein